MPQWTSVEPVVGSVQVQTLFESSVICTMYLPLRSVETTIESKTSTSESKQCLAPTTKTCKLDRWLPIRRPCDQFTVFQNHVYLKSNDVNKFSSFIFQQSERGVQVVGLLLRLSHST